MMRRLPELLLLCPLTACASTADVVSPPGPEDYDVYTYHVEVPAIPAEASRTVLSVETNGPHPMVLSIRGLVGNAPFEVPLGVNDPDTFTSENLSVVYSTICHYVYGTWSLHATTPGKPLELDIRVGYPKGSADVRALETALVGCTSAKADGRPIEGVTTRLARAR